jgi:hypothetical protein
MEGSSRVAWPPSCRPVRLTSAIAPLTLTASLQTKWQDSRSSSGKGCEQTSIPLDKHGQALLRYMHTCICTRSVAQWCF